MTMLEKMAEAIGSHLYGYVSPEDTPNTWATASGVARAALLAIREVDQETFNAGWAAMTGEPDAGPGEPWLAMIDAILSEKP